MRWLVPILLFAGAGCVHAPKDVSGTAEVRSSGILGWCVMLNENVILYRVGRPFPRLVIDFGTSDPNQGGPAVQVAKLSAGTRLRIEKVFYGATYDDGWFQANKPVTFARVESGHQGGRLVDLNWHVVPRTDKEFGELYVRCPDDP